MLIVMEIVSLGVGRAKVEAYKCERCGHIWLPREATIKQNRKPVVCGKCKSAYWDIPRPEKSKK
jgi:DNA-directed RNA polymerase subunit RPC12/RpoP